jgi:PadR family transcriptional regulator PadR
MGNVSPVGEFEQLVLLAVLRLGRQAYGNTIRLEIEERTGRPTSRGAVYVTLDRLENKGLLRSELGDALPIQGGRARRYYQVEPDGIAALHDSRLALRSMWTGLEPVLGDL